MPSKYIIFEIYIFERIYNTIDTRAIFLKYRNILNTILKNSIKFSKTPFAYKYTLFSFLDFYDFLAEKQVKYLYVLIGDIDFRSLHGSKTDFVGSLVCQSIDCGKTLRNAHGLTKKYQ